MAGSDVQITLGADASAAVRGLTQFSASLTGLAPQVANLATAFTGLASKISSLSSSVSGLANGLKAAGAQGSDGLAALQKEGGGAASTVESLTGNVTTLLKSTGDLGRGLEVAGLGRFKDQMRQLLGLLKSEPQGDAASGPNGPKASPPSALGVPPPAVAASADKDATCGCDPAAAAACEQKAQTQRTELAAQGLAQRTSDHAGANARIAANDSGVTAASASNQAQQVAVAEDADRAKVASNNGANRQIAAANDRTLKQFQASMNGLVNTFAKGLAQMAEGTKSFGQVMRQVGQQILDDIFRVVVGMVEKWAWGVTQQVLASTQGQALLNALGLRELAAEITRQHAQLGAVVASEKAKTAAQQLGASQGMAISGQAALKDITNSAAQAASAAYNSLAHVPFVGPLLGAAAAATVFAAVMAFKGLVASAAGGYDIPAGVNPLTQLHAQEMVLPARLANPMRDMLASFGSGATAAVASGHTFSFGDTHIHGAPNMSPADFKQALAEHRASVAEAVANALHGGWRPSYRQPVGAL